MTKVILNGCSGKMGKMVVESAKNFSDIEIVAGIDKFPSETSFPIFENVHDVNIDYDVLLDFSRADALSNLLELTEKTKKPLVLCSTGYSKEDLNLINEKSKTLPLFKSANMSLGINLINSLLKKVVPLLYENYDIEIIEKHHNQKVDAPSGTAIKTAELMAEVREPIQQGASDEEELIAGARGANFDGMRIHSVRLPGLVAHQEVIFGNQGEGLTLRHDSYDRSSFMTGVNLGIKEVVKRHELVYGLEHLL